MQHVLAWRQHGADKQNHARCKNHIGRNGVRKYGKPAACFAQHVAALAHLVNGQQQCSCQQRNDKVDDAEQQHRRKYGLRLRGVGKVQYDKLKNANPAGDVCEHHSHLGHEVAWQKIKKRYAHVAGQQHIHATCCGDNVHSGHKSLGKGNVRRRKDKFLAKQMHGLAHGTAQDQVGAGNKQQHYAQNAHVCHGHFCQQVIRDDRRAYDKDQPAEPQCAHPECDRQHQHQAHNLCQRKPPGRIKTVTHAGAAQQRAKVVAHSLPHK